MSQQVGCTPVRPEQMAITGAISALEGQQGALHSMLNNLERVLYGGNAPEISCDKSQQTEGFEERLSDVASSFDRALSKLDRIISKL